MKKQKGISTSSVLVFVVAVLAIVGLLVAYYYLMSNPGFLLIQNNPAPSEEEKTNIAVEKTEEPKKIAEQTEVIYFNVPEILPIDIKKGYCQTNSYAQPYRQDAFRCKVLNTIYDPCFSLSDSSMVYCKMNPLKIDGDFLISLTKPLPKPTIPEETGDDWSWFIELKDGTYCTPYAGTNPPMAGAYYGCKATVGGQTVVLWGKLKKDLIWTAEKAVIVKEASGWVIDSLTEEEIKTVWQ